MTLTTVNRLIGTGVVIPFSRGARVEQPHAARGFQLLDPALNEREALGLALRPPIVFCNR